MFLPDYTDCSPLKRPMTENIIVSSPLNLERIPLSPRKDCTNFQATTTFTVLKTPQKSLIFDPSTPQSSPVISPSRMRALQFSPVRDENSFVAKTPTPKKFALTSPRRRCPYGTVSPSPKGIHSPRKRLDWGSSGGKTPCSPAKYARQHGEL